MALADILFGGYRRRILGLLLLHPEQHYHVREIARLTGTVAGTTGRELKKLTKEDVLTQHKRGNQVAYAANMACPIFAELVSILRKTCGLADVLAEALLPLASGIEAAFVFGSMASGKATPHSDVDVCIVGEVVFSDVVHALYDAQGVLQREINPKCFSASEWALQREKSSAFFKELLNKDVINIIGNRDDIK